MVLEIPNTEYADKNEELADKLRCVSKRRKAVKVSRPFRWSKIRVKGLDDSITPQEIIWIAASKESCWSEFEISSIGEMQQRLPRTV